MQFELFERKSRPTSTVPMIGVQTRGTMSINAAAFELLASTKGKGAARAIKERATKRLGKQTAKVGDGADALVEFLYDRTQQVVGLRLATPESLNSYPVRRQPQSESYLVTAKAFLTFHKIPMDKLRRYTARLYEGNVLGFSLRDDELKSGA
jgi:hypothetical protein